MRSSSSSSGSSASMFLGACQHPSQPRRRRGENLRGLDLKPQPTATVPGPSGVGEAQHPQPPSRQAAVGSLLCFAEQGHEERFRQDQLGRRLYLMRYWAPRSDPALGILLLVLHLTLLLRLALAGSIGGGSGVAQGLELLPFPLTGAYLAWLQLRMVHRWAVGWVRVRSLILTANLLLLAISTALSAPVLLAAALGAASQAGGAAQQASTPLVQLASTACQLAACTVQLTARGVRLLDAALRGRLLSSAPLAACARAAAAVWCSCGGLLSTFGRPAAMWSNLGVWRVLLSELTDPWVLLFVMLPHLAGQPLAVAAGVQLAAAALSAATCRGTCSVLLQGRPSLQRLFIEAGSALDQLTSPVPVPNPAGLPRGWGRVHTTPCCNGSSCGAGASSAAALLCNHSGSSSAAATAAAAFDAPCSAEAVDPVALGACCALRTFVWLACACVLSLRLLYRRELQGRLAWAQRQRWCPESLAQELRWRVVPACVAAAELVLACSLAWHVASLHMLLLPSAPPARSPSQGS